MIITRDDFHKAFIHPENILIKLDKPARAKPYDFGSLCFSNREPIIAGWNTGKEVKSRKVVVCSLQKSRRRLLNSALDYWYTGGYRDSSIDTELRKMQLFIDWCDDNGHTNFSVDETYSVEAYQAYTEHLFDRLIRVQDLQAETACGYQTGAHFVLKLLYPEKITELKASAPIISFERNRAASPEAEAVNRYVSSLITIAKSLKKSLMEEDFPLSINCGEHYSTILPCNKKKRLCSQ